MLWHEYTPVDIIIDVAHLDCRHDIVSKLPKVSLLYLIYEMMYRMVALSSELTFMSETAAGIYFCSSNRHSNLSEHDLSKGCLFCRNFV